MSSEWFSLVICAAVSAQTGFWAKLLTTSALDFLGISLALTEIPQGYQLAWKSKTNSVMIPIRALSILLAVCAFRQLLPSFGTIRVKNCHHKMVESHHLARKVGQFYQHAAFVIHLRHGHLASVRCIGVSFHPKWT